MEVQNLTDWLKFIIAKRNTVKEVKDRAIPSPRQDMTSYIAYPHEPTALNLLISYLLTYFTVYIQCIAKQVEGFAQDHEKCIRVRQNSFLPCQQPENHECTWNTHGLTSSAFARHATVRSSASLVGAPSPGFPARQTDIPTACLPYLPVPCRTSPL